MSISGLPATQNLATTQRAVTSTARPAETSMICSLAGKVRQAVSALIDLIQRILSAVWHFFKGSNTQPIAQPEPPIPQPSNVTIIAAPDSPVPTLTATNSSLPAVTALPLQPTTQAATSSSLASRQPVEPSKLNELLAFNPRALLAQPNPNVEPQPSNDFRVSKTDLWLAASNVIQLGSCYLLKSAIEAGVENSGYLNPAVIGATLAVGGAALHSLSNYWMLPTDTSLVRRVTLFPFASSLPILGSPLGIVQRVSSLYTVSQNSLPKLASAAKNLSTRPLQALTHGAVHAFNLGCEAVSLGTAFGLFGETQPYSSKPKTEQQKPSHSTKPQAEQAQPSTPQPKIPTHLSTLKHLTDPSLNPQHLIDAQKMFSLAKPTVSSQECKNPFLHETCQKICQTIKKSYRHLFKKVHPDKNPNPLATLASTNLNTAKDTLESAYSC